MNRDSTPVRILQITDTHLFADPYASLHAINTRDSLRDVLQRVTQQPKPDLILVTGDLVHDGSRDGYRALFELLRPLAAPVAVIAGNHDDPDVLRANTPQMARFGGAHECGNWRIVLLNSRVPGQAHGHLDNTELHFLEMTLEAAADHPVIVAVHHHPIPIGSTWLDRIALDNPDALFALFARFPNVRIVLCGHVHQEFDARNNGVRILTTPSTCVQFRPHAEDFTVDDQPPGARWLTLRVNGTMDTRVERVPGITMAATPLGGARV